MLLLLLLLLVVVVVVVVLVMIVLVSYILLGHSRHKIIQNKTSFTYFSFLLYVYISFYIPYKTYTS